MSRRYAELPFSLHHRKRYLLHNPEEVEYELHSLFSCPLWCVCLSESEQGTFTDYNAFDSPVFTFHVETSLYC